MSQTHTIRTYNSMIEAETARAYLEAHGVPTIIPDQHAVALQPHLLEIFGGVRIAIDEINKEKAEELLQEVESRSHLRVIDDDGGTYSGRSGGAANREQEITNKKRMQVRYLARFILFVFLVYYAYHFFKLRF